MRKAYLFEKVFFFNWESVKPYHPGHRSDPERRHGEPSPQTPLYFDYYGQKI